jgi:hypothetical protein
MAFCHLLPEAGEKLGTASENGSAVVFGESKLNLVGIGVFLGYNLWSNSDLQYNY